MMGTRLLRTARAILALAVTAIGIFGIERAQAQSDIGVVLMHGKQSTSNQPQGLVELDAKLKAAGIKVVRPSMPWASGYWERLSVTVDQAHVLIDGYAAELRAQGAKRIVVAGHSLGANVALSYAVARGNVAGVVMLGPGHSPGGNYKSMAGYREALQRAGDLMRAGKGSEPFSGPDSNQGKTFTISTTAEAYVSWMSPLRQASMERQAPLLPASIPVFVAVARDDPSYGWTEEHIYKPAAKNPYSQYISMHGDHQSVVSDASGDVVKWLKGLPQ